MATLNYAALQNLFLDRAGANVSTDAPVSAAEIARFLNEAYSDIWEVSGGAAKIVDSATAWAATSTAVGTVQGLLTDINEPLRIWPVLATSLQSLSCVTNSTTAVTSATLFGTVTAGMLVSGTGIPAGAYVASVTSTSALTLSHAATTSANPVTLTFTPIVGAQEMDRAEMSFVRWLRGSSLTGTTARPTVYAIERVSHVATMASVGLHRMEYAPGSTGYVFPMEYQPQFTEIDSSTVTTPDVNDLESRDIGLLAAARLAPLIGRAELVPSILADVSERTAKALERKIAAMLSADQDSAARA